MAQVRAKETRGSAGEQPAGNPFVKCATHFRLPSFLIHSNCAPTVDGAAFPEPSVAHLSWLWRIFRFLARTVGPLFLAPRFVSPRISQRAPLTPHSVAGAPFRPMGTSYPRIPPRASLGAVSHTRIRESVSLETSIRHDLRTRLFSQSRESAASHLPTGRGAI